MKLTRYLKITLLVLLLFTFITGCQIQDENLDGENAIEDDMETIVEYSPVPGGQIVVPLTNFDTLNPLMTENSSYYFFSKLMFEGLFEFDEDLNIKNQLAKSYAISDGGRTIEIQLLEDVYWHDGEKLTAKDIQFTINTIKYADTNSTYKQMFSKALGSFSPSDLRRIIDIKLLDDTSLEISFDRAFSNNLEVLTFPIIPEHLFATAKGGNKDYAKALEINNYNPIGTGPFKFEAYEKMKQINLSANENYRGQRPYIDHIIGKVLENEEDILTAFETGQINMATTVGVDWDKYKQNNRIRSYEFVSNHYEFLGFNFSNEIFSGEAGRSLRRAIAYGVDRQAIIQNLYLGHGTQIDVPIHPDSWLLSPKANSYGYNFDLARNELMKIGYMDKDGDGILEDEEGNKLSLTLLTNSYNLMRYKTAELIKNDLAKLGIEIKISPLPNLDKDISVEDIERQWEELNEQLIAGDYDIALLGWQLSVIPDLSFAFHSSQIAYESNFINYSNEKMDQSLESAFLEGDRGKKLGSYEQIQGIIVEELPYFSLFFKNKALLIDRKIMGDLSPSFYNPYSGIENVFIPEDLR
ncbi:MAG: peptide ABC transporter substrate-binding protein [Tissierellaceae bacterium]